MKGPSHETTDAGDLLGGGTFLPSWAYRSREIYDIEMESVFPRSWVFVGDTGQLAAPGDFITEIVGTEPVVILRDRQGELRCLSNVCTHRAATIAAGSGNTGRFLSCPYHGWSFGLDGHLAGAPMLDLFDTAFDRGCLNLREFRIDVWERFIFVNLDGAAPVLSDYLEEVPGQLAGHRLASLECTHQIDEVWEGCNWKVVVDNANCDYHLPVVHPMSLGRFANAATLEETSGINVARARAPWRPEQLESVGRSGHLSEPAASNTLAFSVFPNFFIAAFPSGGATVMWWSPIDQTTTRSRVRSYASAASDPRADHALLQAVQDEDRTICQRVQQGLASNYWRPGPRHHLELRIHTFHRRLAEMLSSSVPAGAT
jgi:phenylpropionate dioxygenase-like ring-hydroxylating dioxygenase large terminal subunit